MLSSDVLVGCAAVVRRREPLDLGSRIRLEVRNVRADVGEEAPRLVVLVVGDGLAEHGPLALRLVQTPGLPCAPVNQAQHLRLRVAAHAEERVGYFLLGQFYLDRALD